MTPNGPNLGKHEGMFPLILNQMLGDRAPPMKGKIVR